MIYNIGLPVALILALPLLIVKAIRVPGYTAWIGRRLGLIAGGDGTACSPRKGKLIWLHALSVGETVAARPLLRALRHRYPEATLVLSNSTRAGAALAAASCTGLADRLEVLPYDLPWVMKRLVRRLRPDLFILVETDFWPNLLRSLAQERVPLLLSNGRLSASSWRWYQRLRFLVRPLLFDPFAFLAMQTEAEAVRLRDLGLPPARVGVLGNLKYPAALDPWPPASSTLRLSRELLGIEPDKLLWLAGSTHAGEEEILLRAWRRLNREFPELVLLLAPRRVERAGAVLELARRYDPRARLRTAPSSPGIRVLILDSYGELAALYPLSDLAFVGGSLVPAGGHNPLEAAAGCRPSLFGPHMEDFAEISLDLLTARGACQVKDEEEIVTAVTHWLREPAVRAAAGGQAGQLVATRSQGVLAAHLEMIAKLLGSDLPPEDKR
ncbi:3-deoxy-D-manno-octulosonic acid transferase [Desulfurivibrio sp. D14AmB]|uniref:3-deoxy-D-manno-octulosonic acid transferase n=1 Tax=Desulfurivibrio sp. D14AmB TaxID=3374370 RepID=UPI00376EBA37